MNTMRSMMSALDNFRKNSGLFSDHEWRKRVIKYSALYVLLITIVAIFSYDFFYPDEHFQTIEFASYKSGITAIEHMPWEFTAKMRSWLQPSLYYTISRFLFSININDTFIHAFAYRMLGAFLGLAAILMLMLSSYTYNKDKRNAIAVMFVFLWALPWIIVRTSSETYAGIFAAISIGYMSLCSSKVSEYKRLYPPSVMFITGILLGCAFQFRFQSAFLIFGIVVWLLFISSVNSKERIRNIEFIGTGFLVTFIAGILIDYWGYEQFNFTSWNYFHENIIQKASERWGTGPFWDYLVSVPNVMSDTTGLSVFKILPVISIAALIIFWIRYPKHILTWASISFIFFHTITPHKEARFMFPLVFFMPIMIALAFSGKEGGLEYTIVRTIWGLRKKRIMYALYALNISGILYMIYAASSYSNVNHFFRYFYYNYKSGITIYSEDTWPVELGGTIVADFYYRNNIHFKHADYESFKNIWKDSDSPLYFKARNFDLPYDELRTYAKPVFEYENRKYTVNHLLAQINHYSRLNIFSNNPENKYELIVFKVEPPYRGK